MSVSDPLDRMLAARQAEGLPSIAAAVVRDGRLTWSGAVGSAEYDPETPATPDTQYRIGSITKTFTATAIMQLRAAGKLDLDDRLEQHLPGVAAGSPTIRRLLCHLSGLQREVGEMFVSGHSPTEDELVAHLELVLPPGAQHHYSNLAFALLGQVVARTSGQPYTDYVDELIIGPLGLERTTWAPHAPKAQGYLVDEYAGTVWQEPETDLAAASPAGQLWSTVEDLCTWAAFLAAGHDGVLDARSIEEMWFPQVMYYPDSWVLGWGLGLMLHNREGVIYGGHGGAMAGHLAGVFIDRKTRIGGAALTNSGTRADTELIRDRVRGEGRGALAARERAMAARAGAACGRAGVARPLVVGGQRVRLYLAGRRAPGEGGRVAARAVRRRPSSATATAFAPPAAASAASDCASTVTSSSGPAMPSHARRSRSRARGRRAARPGSRRRPRGRRRRGAGILPSGATVRPRSTIAANAAAAEHRRDLDHAKRQRQAGSDDPRQQADGGRHEDRDLHRGRDRDLGRERRVPAPGDHDGSAVLGRVADDRDDHDRDEELAQSDRFAEVVERVDEDLGDEGRRDRRHREQKDRVPQRPCVLGRRFARRRRCGSAGCGS